MNLKPLYRSEKAILIGLKADFIELCVLDGLVIEVDLDKRKVLGEPVSGLKILKKGSYAPIRQNEKREYSRAIEKKLKRKLIKKIEDSLEDPPRESIKSLAWIPERLGGNGNNPE